MEISNKFTLILKDFEKCMLIADADCPVGKLYDYSCALKSFMGSKIAEVEAQDAQQKQDPVEPPADQKEEKAPAAEV